MGATLTCMKCRKGISRTEQYVIIDEMAYHAKCAKRIEKSKK